ncbi:hypothetical protein ACOMHN_031139 [Nucella lapillus]
MTRLTRSRSFGGHLHNKLSKDTTEGQLKGKRTTTLGVERSKQQDDQSANGNENGGLGKEEIKSTTEVPKDAVRPRYVIRQTMGESLGGDRFSDVLEETDSVMFWRGQIQ